MSDNLNAEDRRKTMQAVKGRGTKLEKSLWAMLAGMGVKGWKKNASNIIGKPDVVFFSQRVAVFIDGCFWHGCPYCQRKLPRTNQEYWERKIRRNVELSQLYNRKLREVGWTVVRIWEHEMVDRAIIRKRIVRSLTNKNP